MPETTPSGGLFWRRFLALHRLPSTVAGRHQASSIYRTAASLVMVLAACDVLEVGRLTGSVVR